MPTSRPRTSRSRPSRAIFAARGDAGAGIDAAVGSLEALLELSARHEAEGLGDAPWPPNYAKQAGEPPRVQPSRKRRADSDYASGEGVAGGPPPEVAEARAAAVAAGDRNAGLPHRVGRHAPDAHRPPPLVDPGDRDRPRRVQGRGPGGLRAMVGRATPTPPPTSSPRTC